MKFQRTSSQPAVIFLKGYDICQSDTGSDISSNIGADASSEVRSSWLSTLWQQLTAHVSPEAIWAYLAKFAIGSSDPVVQQRRDRQGHAYYAVYDPTTGQRSIFTTEAEVRAWLEQRYHQKGYH